MFVSCLCLLLLCVYFFVFNPCLCLFLYCQFFAYPLKLKRVVVFVCFWCSVTASYSFWQSVRAINCAKKNTTVNHASRPNRFSRNIAYEILFIIYLFVNNLEKRYVRGNKYFCPTILF